jgi:hypothetical protein
VDPIKNPFSPGAGAPPPELVGRDGVLQQASVLLGRIKERRPEKSLLLTGLRGVGKTVLLNEMERMAIDRGYRTITIEAHEEKRLGPLLAANLQRLLFDLDRLAGATDKVNRAFRVLRSFFSGLKVTTGDFTISLDVEPERGAADSGDIEIDLPNLMISIGEAAADRNAAIAILVDEIQYFEPEELGALIMAMHRMQQRQLPIVLVGAGLPILPALAGESKSYAERLFNFPDIGALSEDDSGKALREPAQAVGVHFDESALAEVFRLTKGYPYFVQEWGYQSWNHAGASPITVDTVRSATPMVIRRLDENFFCVRYDRLTPSEKNFLRAMAALGAGSQRTADIADRLSVKISTLGPVRAKLIRKGMIYSPAHGEMAFTVPLFDEFMIRAIPQF